MRNRLETPTAPQALRPSRSSTVWLAVLTLLALAGCGEPQREPKAPVELFTRHWHEPIYQEDLPSEAEVGHAVELAATPGEYESASIGVRTQVPLRQARFTASPLLGEHGGSIDPQAIEWRFTEYIDPGQFQQFRRWIRNDDHPRPPGFLQPIRPIEIAAGSSQQFWLTIRVPDEAAAGRYRGTLTFEAEGTTPLTLPIELEVYPFRLQEAAPMLYAAGDNWPLSAEAFADCRAHGMNTVLINSGHLKVIGQYDGGHFSYPGMIEKVSQAVELARQHGLGVERGIGLSMQHHLGGSAAAGLAAAGITHPAMQDGFDDREDYWIFYDQDEAVELNERFRGTYYPTPNPYGPPTTEYGKLLYQGWVESFRLLEATARERGWPRLWYWLSDEPHVNRGRLRAALTMTLAARDAGARSMITCNEPTVSEPDPERLWYRALGSEPDLRLAPFLQVRCYYNAYLSEETLERTRADKADYGAYVNIYGNQPASVRFQTGMLAYRLSLDMIMMWSYFSVGTDMERPPRGYLRDWEAVREGIDDLKYFEALQRAVASEAGPIEQRVAAKELLDELRRDTPTNVRAVGFVDSFTGEWVRGKETWKPERFDQMRRRAAQAIAALQGAAR